MPADWPAEWLPFSPTERRLLAAMTGEWQPARALADKAHVEAESDLLPILRNLCEREILESATGRGFRWKGGVVPAQLPPL